MVSEKKEVQQNLQVLIAEALAKIQEQNEQRTAERPAKQREEER